jgi:hypothetical protein
MSISVSDTFEFIRSGTKAGMVTEVVTSHADASRYRAAMTAMGLIDDDDWQRLEAGQTLLKDVKGVSMFLRVKFKH